MFFSINKINIKPNNEKKYPSQYIHNEKIGKFILSTIKIIIPILYNFKIFSIFDFLFIYLFIYMIN